MNKGLLFLMVGDSGTGKDTIINYVTEELPDLRKIKRCITRPNHDDSEEFTSLTTNEFEQKDFFIKWVSYDAHYGVPLKVLKGLEDGENYAVNVSRSVINEVKSEWSETYVIELNIPVSLVKKRLEERDREDSEGIEERLNRALNSPSVDADVNVDTSNSDVSVAGDEVLSFIKERL